MAKQNWIEKNGKKWMGKNGSDSPPPPRSIWSMNTSPPPPTPRTPTPPPPGMPPTFKDYIAWARKGMANVGGTVNQVAGEAAQAVNRGVGYAGEVANRAGQVASNAYYNARVAGNQLGQGVRQATQPIRDEEAERAWETLQYYNYFYGLPYATISYKEHIRSQNLRLHPKHELLDQNAPDTQPAAGPAAPWENYTPSDGTHGATPAIQPTGANNPQSYAEYMSSVPKMPPPAAPVGQSWAQQLDNAGGVSPAAQTALSQPQINMQWLDYWNGRGPRPDANTIYQP